MGLVLRANIEGTDSGHHFIPDKVLERMHPEVKMDTASAYAKIVADYPNYDIRMVQDNVKGGLTIYWTRLV